MINHFQTPWKTPNLILLRPFILTNNRNLTPSQTVTQIPNSLGKNKWTNRLWMSLTKFLSKLHKLVHTKFQQIGNPTSMPPLPYCTPESSTAFQLWISLRKCSYLHSMISHPFLTPILMMRILRKNFHMSMISICGKRPLSQDWVVSCRDMPLFLIQSYSIPHKTKKALTNNPKAYQDLVKKIWIPPKNSKRTNWLLIHLPIRTPRIQ
jgi:hypothetical protein